MFSGYIRLQKNRLDHFLKIAMANVQPAQLCAEDDPQPTRVQAAALSRRPQVPTPLVDAPSYDLLRETVKTPHLAFDQQETDRKSGLMRVPLVYGCESLLFRSSRAGPMKLPFGISEPFGSKGGGPVRNGRKTPVGVYSAFIEVSEDEGGADFMEFLKDLQSSILEQVVQHKTELGMPMANRSHLEDSMHPLYKDNQSHFSESLAGIRVKVNIGGRNAVRCTRKGVPIQQSPVSTLSPGCSVDPTWAVKGIWAFQGKWGIIVHMVQADIVSHE